MTNDSACSAHCEFLFDMGSIIATNLGLEYILLTNGFDDMIFGGSQPVLCRKCDGSISTVNMAYGTPGFHISDGVVSHE